MANDYYTAASQGYVNVQQQISQMGLLGGSMQPMDGRGTAVQFPTLPPPRFTSSVGTTSYAPVQAPSVAPPQLLSHGLTAQRTSYSPAAPYMPAPSYPMNPYASQGGGYSAPAMPAPVFVPYPSMPASPMRMGGSIGSLYRDSQIAAGQLPPGITGGGAAARANAAGRVSNTMADISAKGLLYGGIGLSVAGGVAAMSAAGGSTAAMLGMAAVPAAVLTAGLQVAGGFVGKRNRLMEYRKAMGGLTTGALVDPTGMGLSIGAANDIDHQMKQAAKTSGIGHKMLSGVGGAATQLGLMQGHTGSTQAVVSRIKNLAELTKSIVSLGEGISAGDAMQLQALSQQLGIGTTALAGKDIARKLVVTARTAGMTFSGMAKTAAAGAGLYSTSGMSGTAGMLTAAHSAAQAHSLASSGVFGVRQMAQLGGESGIASSLLKGQAAVDKRVAQSLVYGSMKFGGEGDFSIQETLLQRLVYGDDSLASGKKRGLDFLKSKKMTKEQRSRVSMMLKEQMPDLVESVQDKLSPQERQAMVFRQILDHNKENKGFTVRASAEAVLGSESAAKSYLALAKDTSWVADRQRQKRLATRNELSASAAGWGNERRLGSRIGQVFSVPLDLMSDWGESISDSFTRRDAISRNQAAGIYYGHSDYAGWGSDAPTGATQRSMSGAKGKVLDDMVKDIRSKGVYSLMQELGGAKKLSDRQKKLDNAGYIDPQRAWELFGGQASQLKADMDGDNYFGLGTYSQSELKQTFDRRLESSGALKSMFQGMDSGYSQGNRLGMVATKYSENSSVQRAVLAAQRAGVSQLHRGANTAKGGLIFDGSTRGMERSAIEDAMIASIDKSSLSSSQKRKLKADIRDKGSTSLGTSLTGQVYESGRKGKSGSGVARFIKETGDISGFKHNPLSEGLDATSLGALLEEDDYSDVSASDQVRWATATGFGGASNLAEFVEKAGASGLSSDALNYLTRARMEYVDGDAMMDNSGLVTNIQSDAAVAGNDAAKELRTYIAKHSDSQGDLKGDAARVIALAEGIDYTRGGGNAAINMHQKYGRSSHLVKGMMAKRAQGKAHAFTRSLTEMGLNQGDFAKVQDFFNPEGSLGRQDAIVTAARLSSGDPNDIIGDILGTKGIDTSSWSKGNLDKVAKAGRALKNAEVARGSEAEGLYAKDLKDALKEAITEGLEQSQVMAQEKTSLEGLEGKDKVLVQTLLDIQKAIKAQGQINRDLVAQLMTGTPAPLAGGTKAKAPTRKFSAPSF